MAFLFSFYLCPWHNGNLNSMTNKLLALAALGFLFLTGALRAQQTHIYVHMKGSLGSNIRVDADMERTGNKMEGSYSYNLYVDDSLMHLSPIVTLYGDIDKRNHVVFKRIPGNDTTLTGLFTDHRFTGLWHGTDTLRLPFDWEESRSEGTLPLEVFYLHSGEELAPQARQSPSAEIELTLLYPENNGYRLQKTIDSVKKHIQMQFFGTCRPEKSPQALLNQTGQNFYTRFRELNNRWKTRPDLWFNMEKRENMTVLFNTHNLLCLQYKKKGYSGRGNPMLRFSYDLIDLRDGRKLRFDDIFEQNARAAITRLINRSIREENGLAADASLKKIGFFTDTVSPGNNISFNGNGITFVYNVYDIAPPAMGLQKAFLPFSQIGRFIKPTSVLYPLSR